MTKQFDNQHNKMSKTHKRYWNVPPAELDSFKHYMMTILSNNEENIIRHVMESHSILVTKHGDIHLAAASATYLKHYKEEN